MQRALDDVDKGVSGKRKKKQNNTKLGQDKALIKRKITSEEITQEKMAKTFSNE